MLSSFRGQLVGPSHTTRTMFRSAYASRFRVNRYDTVVSHGIVPVYYYVFTVPYDVVCLSLSNLYPYMYHTVPRVLFTIARLSSWCLSHHRYICLTMRAYGMSWRVFLPVSNESVQYQGMPYRITCIICIPYRVVCRLVLNLRRYTIPGAGRPSIP